MALGERDPTFVAMQRYEGNIAVAEHPTDPASYGDGSIEISGSLHTDFIRSATPGHTILLKNPVVWQTLPNRPPPPTSAGVQLYSDGQNSGRIVMVDSTGTFIDLNPLKSVGDLMTFDGVKNSTVRFPSGFAGQKLVCDPNVNFATRLLWKSDEADVYQVSSPSDGYLRYCECCNTAGSSLTNTPQQISLDDPLRTDLDTFSIAGGISVLQNGMYEVTFSVDVSFDPTLTSEMTTGQPACVETYMENSDTGGYSVIPGTKTYRYMTYVPNSNTESSDSIVIRCLLNLVANTGIRFYASEYNTSTGALRVKPSHARLSIVKLDWNDPASGQYLVLQGTQGARPVIGTDFVTLPITTVIYQSNQNDIVGTNSVTISDTGVRHVIVKTTFNAYNVNSNLTAVVETAVLVNGTAPPSGVSRSSLLGTNGNGTSIINCVHNVQAEDVISVQSKMVSSNLSMGVIVAVSEECTVSLSLPNQTCWKRLTLRSDSSYVANPSRFDDLDFDVTDVGGVDPSDYKVTGAISELFSGGTYQYVFSADFQNADNTPYTGLIRLMADTGNGFKEVPGSGAFVTLSAGMAQTVFQSATVYLSPHSVVKCQILSPDGGNVQVMENTAHFVISKYETTKTSYVGLSDFGRFGKFISDDNEVLTTSTDFALRLATGTIDVSEGYYRAGLSFEWDMSDAGVGFETELVVDNTTVVDSFCTVPVITGAFTKVTSFQQLHLDAGEHQMAFNTRVLDSTRALHTRKVRIEFWKI
jgi:hypothetical protein